MKPKQLFAHTPRGVFKGPTFQTEEQLKDGKDFLKRSREMNTLILTDEDGNVIILPEKIAQETVFYIVDVDQTKIRNRV